jgi:hypothetical protein
MFSRKLFGVSRAFSCLCGGVTLLCLFLAAGSPAQAQVSLAWATRYGAPNLTAEPVASAADAEGNTYVTGTVIVPSGDSFHEENLTIKYDVNGNIVWKNWLGSAAHPAQASALALDSSANVYVLAAVGETVSSGTSISNSAFATIKYNSSGVREWVDYFSPPSGGSNFPAKLAVTPAGNVYITGSTAPAGNSGSQALTAKYDTSGAELWSRHAPIPLAGGNLPTALGLDAAENVYVGVLSTHVNPTVYKYDSAGNLLASIVVKAVDNFAVFYVDPSGDMYTAGCSAPGPVALKLDTNGNELWTHPFTPSRCFSAIQLDSQKNVVLAQTLGSAETPNDISVVKLDPNGFLLWENRFNGSPNSAGHDNTQGLAIDSADNIYLTGFTQTNPGTNGNELGDLIAFKYSPTGQQLWSQRFADASPSAASPAATTLAPGNVLVISSFSLRSTLSLNETDWITLAFTQTTP